MNREFVNESRPRTSAVLVLVVFTVFATALTGASQTRKVAGGVSVERGKVPLSKSERKAPAIRRNGDDETNGKQIVSEIGIQRVTDEITQTQFFAPKSSRPPIIPERDLGENKEKKQNPDAPAVAQWPLKSRLDRMNIAAISPAIHTLANSFDGATLTDTGAFPPDSMGTIGPTQFIAFENGRIRSFLKAGTADGVLNADPDVFFASVMTPVSGSVVLNFTSDPQIRYDRFTARWYLTIIDVPCTNATCTTTAPNRVLMSVSDAASNGTITGSTVWTFFQFQADPGTGFCDYPSLGMDVNALYIGCNMFSSAGAFVGTNGYVVRKSTTLGVGPITVTAFANMAAGAGAGPESPRGVDNFDLGATEGYFVGPDNASFSSISFRRVSNPGSATPTISANITVVVPTTTSPNRVEHAGNTVGGANGNLDSLDDRFFQVMIRNGRMWTAHNFRVSAAGVASTAVQSRNAVRWYEFQNLTTTPTVVQSGTVFDNAATRAAARQYWIPSVAVTGQGHAVMGMTMAGTPVGATPVFVGRLVGDTLGTMNGPPTVAAATFGTTTANYNPPSDPGGANGRRWGDYSFTVVDPLDDMTVWTIQEYNQALNSYAVRAGRLIAPPPAAPTANSVSAGLPSANVAIVGTSASGSGFYDPGANLPAPARPFTHITASVSGTNVVVNSVTYTDPTHITLNLNTVGAAANARTLTITNPDGQQSTGTLTITAPTAAPADIGGRVLSSDGRGIRGALVRIRSADGTVNLSVITNSFGYYTFPAIATGVTYVISVSSKLFRFSPSSIVYDHLDTISGLNFIGQE